MKINISYTKRNIYKDISLKQWFFMFKRYHYISGFMFRIFGVYFNVREKNSTEKLIKIARK